MEYIFEFIIIHNKALSYNEYNTKLVPVLNVSKLEFNV